LKADALCLTRKTAQLDENVLQIFYKMALHPRRRLCVGCPIALIHLNHTRKRFGQMYLVLEPDRLVPLMINEESLGLATLIGTDADNGLGQLSLIVVFKVFGQAQA